MSYQSKDVIKGFIWSGLDRFGVVVIQLVLELLIARILLPKDYGVVGIILIFITLAITFSEGGFSNALIHKQNRDDNDYSAVFYFNIGVGILVYLLIFFIAPSVEEYFNIGNLSLYLRVTCISILFSSSVLVHRTKLTILMDFKKQAKYSLISVFVAGMVSLWLAYRGFGVWALIVQTLILNIINAILLWIGLKWLPQLKFSYSSLKGLFSFGSKILLSSILQSVYFNAYPFFIGKVLSTRQLGIYSKANQFTQMPSSVLTTVIQRVLFPFFSSHQNDDEKVNSLNVLYTKLCSIAFLPIFFTLAILAKPLIIFAFSEKWAEMIPVFIILCISYTFYPITVNNMMIFQVKNKTGLFLKIEIVSKIIGVTILFLTIKHGLIALSFGILANQLLQFIISSLYMQSILNRNLFKQIRIVMPFYLFSTVLLFAMNYLFSYFEVDLFIHLLLGFFIIATAYLLFYFLFYKNVFIEIKSLLKNKNL